MSLFASQFSGFIFQLYTENIRHRRFCAIGQYGNLEVRLYREHTEYSLSLSYEAEKI